MVHGLHQKSKQRVAHYLNHRNTEANLFVKFLNGVISAHQNVGLHVVSSILDTGVKNVSLEIVCYQTEAILQVSESRYCECVILHT
jgi:ferredoxin-thioredoxin reductase catalytic subunit